MTYIAGTGAPEVRCLPTVRLKIGKRPPKRYYVDDRLRQLRNVHNPHDFLSVEQVGLLILAGTVQLIEGTVGPWSA